MKFKQRPTIKSIVIEKNLPTNPVRGGPASNSRSGIQMLNFELLNIIEFSSARKRMTVIVKDQKTGEIKVLTKGADSIIMDLLVDTDESAEGANQAQVRHSTSLTLLEHAKTGLRTLLLAEKTITESEYKEWKVKLDQAEATQGSGKKRKLEKVHTLIENGFNLIGSTAVQDNLQDNVPETLSKFKKAGICTWILTGDKEETAVNVGFAAGMINAETQRLFITSGNSSKLLSQIKESKDVQIQTKGKTESCIIVSGNALPIIMQNPNIRELFLGLVNDCDSVISCRMSPKQKADLVNFMKQYNGDKVVLAVGDGANDVSMITQAHIGIGIAGMEGGQAVSASDYSISEFQ